MLWTIIRRFLFLLDPELAHDFGCLGLRILSFFTPKKVLLARRKSRFFLAGIPLDSPLGLAAGFDKDAKMIPALRSLGFAFIEVGSVTPLAQPGNPKPRLFRLPHSKALINRMGFNSDGADVVAERLRNLRASGQIAFPIGVNLGKNRNTALEKAHEDYLLAMEKLYAVSDYLVINLSSPNTPSLTDLQEEAFLAPLLGQIRERRDALANGVAGMVRPLFLKISPDLKEEAEKKAIEIAMAVGFSGIIATNTSRRRGFAGLDSRDKKIFSEEGGLSGRPLMEESLTRIKRLRGYMSDKACLIAAGGISSIDDGRACLDAGASLLQVYTGFIYGGPRFAKEFRALE